MIWHRPAVMAGKFYPGEKRKLLDTIEQCLGKICSHPQVVWGLMAPHAGYIYSGKTAGEVFSQVKISETVIVLCPNHTGRGPGISVWSEGTWETPLGKISVDENLARDFMKELKIKDGDMLAHLGEHAIEVELPFLQVLQPRLKILPVVLGYLRFEECLKVAHALQRLLEKRPKGEVLLLASSDMSHYIPAEEARKKDEIALKHVDQIDAKGLYEAVIQEDLSMCGFVPTTCVLEASKLLGAKTAKRLSYSTSGEVTGDFNSVVAYANAYFY